MTDLNHIETKEWIESLDYVIHNKSPEEVKQLLRDLQNRAAEFGIQLPYAANTPYVNTISIQEQPLYPGDDVIERRIRSIVRWNALAMVVRANRQTDGIGGHISTYASCATLLEVGFNHFFRGKDHPCGGDLIYFQGHAAPGIYARAFLEGRLSEQDLNNFRRELKEEGGLSSYPHPYCMPHFWEFPTVSMGLGPILAIYQARFNRYLEDRGLIKNKENTKVWTFIGDGETDEPETLGAITLASREKLDNLIFVINCNLQRLDGPVRGNYKIIQELEAIFRGAGWNVIKVIWGGSWDRLLEKDESGVLVRRMEQAVDGDYQMYSTTNGAYVREHFFGTDESLQKLVQGLTDEEIMRLKRGGHDAEKVYAAYRAATECKGTPTVILAKTIKGYGLGEAGEGKNITHQQKKLNEEELRRFRSRFNIPISDEQVGSLPFYRPVASSEEMRYILEKRKNLGGFVPTRNSRAPALPMPNESCFSEFFQQGSHDREVSTTMIFGRLLSKLLADNAIGRHIVPIIPDEARTFGMEALFRQVGIYSHIGQRYEPVDKDTLLYYKEARDGQIIEEGITEAGAISSFIAAGSSYASHNLNMIPFFIYYSMFGFQRIGDLIWAAGDMGCRGFLVGGTAGRTTLAGEGLQHQDGHSHLLAYPYPHVRAYEPAFAYEIATIVEDGLQQMFVQQKNYIYYITLGNEPYIMPPPPKHQDFRALKKQILQGMYLYRLAQIPSSASRASCVNETTSTDLPVAKQSNQTLHVATSNRSLLGRGKTLDSVDASLNKTTIETKSRNTGYSFASSPARAYVQLLSSGSILRESLRAADILEQDYGIAVEVWNVTSYKQLFQDLIETERYNRHHPEDQQRLPYISQCLRQKSDAVIAVSDYTRSLPLSLANGIKAPFVALGTDGFGRSDSRAALRSYFEVDAAHTVVTVLSLLAREGRLVTETVRDAMQRFRINPEKIDVFS